MKKILIIGAGVMGSLYAAKLSQAGEDVTLLARKNRLTQIRKKGIVFQDAFTNKRSTIQIKTTERLSPDDIYDFVAIHVRSNQIATLLPMLSNNKKIPTYIFMVNYPQGFQNISAQIGKERIVIGFPGAGGTITNDGTLLASVAPGFAQATTFGEFDGKKTERIKQISSIYRLAGFPTTLSSNMDGWLKTHIVWTLPFECMLYHYDYNCSKIAHDVKALETIALGIKEGIMILKALHIPILPLQIKIVFEKAPMVICKQILKAWFSSKNAEVYMAEHSKNAPDEAYFLSTEFKKLIQESTIETPYLDQLYSYIPNK